MKQLYTLLLALACCLSLNAQSDQYLHLDRIDDFVQTPNGSGLISGGNAFSMTGWFWTDEYAYGQGMMGIRGNNAGFYLIQLDNGKIECRFQNSAGTLYEYVAPQYTIVPETWQHYAWVYDGAKVYLYLNGVLKGSKTASGTINATNVAFTIGKSLLAGFNFVYGGRVDEVTLWKKALSEAEIQDMMANELTGTETNLVLYYKCNQGLPGGDNTSISKLDSEVGGPERDGDLLNFAMNGPTSNFNGTLNTGFQAITFPQIPNKLTTDAPFALDASASSGLPVAYEVVSGPATVNGATLTLTGQAGAVTVRASQSGDASYEAADPIESTFQVLDPIAHVPDVDARNPLAGDVFVPQLGPIQLAAIASITYPELFSVQNVQFSVDGQSVAATNWGNTHYTAWWTPPAYGSYTLSISAANNYGSSSVLQVPFNVVQQSQDIDDVVGVADIWTNPSITFGEGDGELPCFVGAFEQITGTLEVKCPPGGCGEWDRVAWVEAQGHDGQWIQIIRYITPYGVPCNHTIDLTDYQSVLQGKIRFRVNAPTLDNGFQYTLKLDYKAGTPAHRYSAITRLWYKNYPFGDPANLQPTENLDITYPPNAVASKIKLVSTGHGWGDNNTGNAAEFHDDTHHIWVNGAETFEQHNWKVCNPNPDGCQPQNGTWYFNRAGWCPGSIAPWFDYDMTPFVGPNPVDLAYIFDEDYTDLCHVNNPACVSGVTCPDCNDGFNPQLEVACNLITFADAPVDGAAVTDGAEPYRADLGFSVYPNPSNGIFQLILKEEAAVLDVQVTDAFGRLVTSFRRQNGAVQAYTLDLSGQAPGVYFVTVNTGKGTGVKKVLLEGR